MDIVRFSGCHTGEGSSDEPGGLFRIPDPRRQFPPENSPEPVDAIEWQDESGWVDDHLRRAENVFERPVRYCIGPPEYSPATVRRTDAVDFVPESGMENQIVDPIRHVAIHVCVPCVRVYAPTRKAILNDTRASATGQAARYVRTRIILYSGTFRLYFTVKIKNSYIVRILL